MQVLNPMTSQQEHQKKKRGTSYRKLYQDPDYFFEHDTNIPFDSVGLFTYLRTYARRIDEDNPNSLVETWQQCVKRVVLATNDQLGCGFKHEELVELYGLLYDLKCSVAGRFLWQLGTRTVSELGLPSLQNCSATVIDDPIEPFTWTMSFLMLGCGVGYRLLPEDIDKLPVVKYAEIVREDTKDADFVLPDSRQGWVKLLGKVLKAHFYAGKGFTYSCMLLRSKGAPIKGFGGVASGPEALCDGIAKINTLLNSREGQKLRPVDALDIMNIIGMIVIAGNVRRSAQVAIGDHKDIEYLRAKRWDLGGVPNWRAFSNNSVVCNDITEVLENDEFWEGYLGNGEPYGLINLDLSRSVGRLGETEYPDPDVQAYNPCCEQSLANSETCCLGELYLPNIASKEELFTCAKYIYRICKHSLALPCHESEETEAIVHKNMRMGIGVTGYLQATVEQRSWLKECYEYLRAYDKSYSKRHKFPESIKLTTVKPSGTLSLLAGCTSGVHPGYARYYIRRIRLASESPLVKLAETHRLPIEYVRNFDGTIDRSTKIVSFPYSLPENTVLANDVTAIEQLEYVKELQTNWSDNSVSCCLAKGHYVHTDDGFVDISDLCGTRVEGEYAEHCVRVLNHKGEPEMSTHGYYNGEQRTLVVTLSDGNTIQATENHRVMTNDSWKRLDELVPGDVVLRHRGLNQWAEPEASEKLLCGFDGNFPKSVSPELSLWIGMLYGHCPDESEWNELCTLLFGSPLSRSRVLDDETFSDWFSAIGMSDGVPKLILQSPLECVVAFLRGRLEVYKEDQCRYNVAKCRTRTSAHEIALLLNNLGVITTIDDEFRVYVDAITWVWFTDSAKIFPCVDEIGVVSIVCGDICETFDITTDTTHSYLANGFVTHNTIYYRKDELDSIKKWLKDNYTSSIKTISFLLHNEHGFDQAPLEEITKDQYDEMVRQTGKIDSYDGVCYYSDEINFGEECAGGSCPIR